MIIRGNTVGTTMPRANWNQQDAHKADFIRGKETVEAAITAAAAAAQNHAAQKNNPHGITVRQIGAAAENHSHSASQVGAVTEAQVKTMIQEELGVIEHGAY